MRGEYIGWPPEEVKRLAINRKFYNIAKLANVCGAIDGTHVNVVPPKDVEDSFVNRHRRHSLNVCAVAGPSYEFYHINTRHAGRAHDSGVLMATGLWTTFEGGFRPFLGAVLLGDSAYPLRDWLMTPFRSTVAMTPAMSKYQNAHTKTRAVVERAFGVLKMRFRALFNAGLRVAKMSDAANIIIAACVIHNICIRQGDEVTDLLEEFDASQEDPDMLQEDPDMLPDVPAEAPPDVAPESANERRNRYVASFN